MTLLNLCKKIHKLTNYDYSLTNDTNAIHVEYSKTVKEKREFDFGNNPLFTLVWNFNKNSLISTLVFDSNSSTSMASYSQGQRTQLHTHEYLELCYVLEGEFKQIILGKTISFSKGDLCLIDMNCIHQDILYEGDATVLFIGFKNDIFQDIIRSNVSNHNLNTFLTSAILNRKKTKEYIHFKPRFSNNTNVENTIQKILNEELDYSLGSAYIIKGLLLRLFYELSLNYEYTLTRDQRSNMNVILFDEITAMMEENCKDISVQDLIDTFHYNSDYYNRLIKNMTGQTYSSYLQTIRLNKAINLLTNSSKKIDDIAEEIGYNNKGYFYKIFQEKYSITPYQYRKNSLTESS